MDDLGESSPNEKLLDRYQAIISRLAGNSTSFKGWARTVATAVIGFGAKDGPGRLAYLSLIPLLLFFLLDAYYLSIERSYRKIYNEIAVSKERHQPLIQSRRVSLGEILSAASRPATWGVYLALALTAVAVGSGLVLLGSAPKTP